MSDLYERIVAERGGFEKMLQRIPGFDGYLDLAARRAADRHFRGDADAARPERHLHGAGARPFRHA